MVVGYPVAKDRADTLTHKAPRTLPIRVLRFTGKHGDELELAQPRRFESPHFPKAIEVLLTPRAEVNRSGSWRWHRLQTLVLQLASALPSSTVFSFNPKDCP